MTTPVSVVFSQRTLPWGNAEHLDAMQLVAVRDWLRCNEYIAAYHPFNKGGGRLACASDRRWELESGKTGQIAWASSSVATDRVNQAERSGDAAGSIGGNTNQVAHAGCASHEFGRRLASTVALGQSCYAPAGSSRWVRLSGLNWFAARST